MFRVSAAFLRRALSFGLIAALTAPLTPPAVRAAATPLPTAELTLPAAGQLGEQVTFTITLSNAAAGTTGYGPYVDLFLPPGADGDDGMGFAAASVVGIALLPYGDRIVCGDTGLFTHPLTELPTPCSEGEEVLVLKLPFLTQTAAQAPLVISVTADVSPKADAGVALTVRAGAGYFLGTDAENNPLVDAPIV